MINFGLIVASFFCILAGTSLVISSPITISSNRSLDSASGIIQWNYGSYIQPINSSVEFSMHIVSPKKPGTYKVIIFAGGFSGFAPHFIYEEFLKSVAIKTNKIVIFYERARFIKLPDKQENLLEVTLNWTVEHMDGLFNDLKSTPKQIRGKVFPDTKTDGFSLMSHSSSGHMVVSYLNKTCGQASSLILLDPVDGYDPFGFVKIFITNPPAQLPFQIPTLIVMNGLDNTSVKPDMPPCAAQKTSNERFYKAMAGPTILANFTTYGHADLLDDWSREFISSQICQMCLENCKYDLYKKMLVQTVTYFLKGLDEKKATYFDQIKHPDKSPSYDSRINIKTISKINGIDMAKTGPFCSHT